MEEDPEGWEEASIVFRKFSTFLRRKIPKNASPSLIGHLASGFRWSSDIREMYEAFRSDRPKVMKFQELARLSASRSYSEAISLEQFRGEACDRGLPESIRIPGWE